MKIINEHQVPIYSWAVNLEDSAREQAKAIADYMPIHHHFALMPDAHMGMGMPIGGVLAMKDAICPNAVGVDIGCGMLAVRTNMVSIGLDEQKQIYRHIRTTVPVGFNKHEFVKEWEGFETAPVNVPIIKEHLNNARKQLGTLGGGNHFIEFQEGSDGHIWFMIHSGSRNIGKQICDLYGKLAEDVGETPLAHMSYFNMGSAEAIEYDLAMNFALDFAYANRAEMSRQIQIAITQIVGETEFHEINIHHNYASLESHGGESVVVHRKGATLAEVGTTGIIPGSQGTPSYIVQGKGNPDSFNSCSHGAGRVMSRTKATGLTRRGKRKFEAGITVEDATKAMGDLLCRFDERNVDEAPQAYKDILEVMSAQDDLVEVLVELKPYQISAIKG